jgi:hypothetical protein
VRGSSQQPVASSQEKNLTKLAASCGLFGFILAAGYWLLFYELR